MEAESEAERATPVHVLVFPLPAQGHVTSMLMLSELLSLAGLHVTFLNTHHNHHRLRSFSGSYDRLAQRPGFSFRSIPDGLPDDHPRSVSSMMELVDSLRTRAMVSFRELLTAGSSLGSDTWPPVTCTVVDGFMYYAVDASEGVGIPSIAFRTVGASCFWAYLCIPNLIKSGELPCSEAADMDEQIRSIPGMESFLRRRDLPSFCRDAKDITEPTFKFLATTTAETIRARGLILNTSEFMEAPLLARIRSHYPTTYALGPIHSLLRTYAARRRPVGGGPGFSISGSLWEEDRSCMAWLDAQPRRSVVYVSFGSFTVMSREQLLEFWHGLVDSGHRFLWVVRPGLVEGGGGGVPPLPGGVEAATRERGCIVGWATQGEVLGHVAVGCFLTHSGWNSTVESVAAGVPMICWPFIGDQQINSRIVSEVWRVGVDMKDTCGRGAVERRVREVMEGERAEELRRSAGEMAEMARRSVDESGTSYTDFIRLIQHINSLSLEVASKV